MNKTITLISCFLLFSLSAVSAQDSVLNKYGLLIINTAASYQKTIADNKAKTMVPLSVKLPGAVIDLKYAGTGNFMHSRLYPALSTSFLRQATTDALHAVQQELITKQLNIKIWDAYRPYSVTEKMWEAVKDERYAADPRFGSGHNRGIAVDLTLVDTNTGNELDMGTGFDNFSDTAHHDFKHLPGNILQNRQLLRSVMEKHGFKALESEWWHYYLPDTASYELLNLSFEELYKASNLQR